MKYYIIRPKCSKKDKKLIAGIMQIDPDAVITDNLEDCDIAVMQRNWTRSKYAVEIYEKAAKLHKRRDEGYLYTDKYKAVVS